MALRLFDLPGMGVRVVGETSPSAIGLRSNLAASAAEGAGASAATANKHAAKQRGILDFMSAIIRTPPANTSQGSCIHWSPVRGESLKYK